MQRGSRVPTMTALCRCAAGCTAATQPPVRFPLCECAPLSIDTLRSPLSPLSFAVPQAQILTSTFPISEDSRAANQSTTCQVSGVGCMNNVLQMYNQCIFCESSLTCLIYQKIMTVSNEAFVFTVPMNLIPNLNEAEADQENASASFRRLSRSFTRLDCST